MKKRNEVFRYRLILLFVMVVGLAFIFMADHVYRANVTKGRDQKLNEAASMMQRHLSIELNNLALVAADLHAFLLTQPFPPDSQSFAAFAKDLHEHYPAIDSLVYVDSERIVREIYPLAGNEHAIGLDLSKRPIAPYIEKSIRERKLIVDPPHFMSNGRLAVIARAPLFKGEKFLGLAQAILRVPDVVQGELADMGSRFTIQLQDKNGKIFWGAKRLEGALQKREVVVADSVWTLSVAPANPSDVKSSVLLLIWGAGIIVMLLTLKLIQNEHRFRCTLKEEVAVTTQRLRQRNEELEKQVQLRFTAEINLLRSEQSLREAQQIAHIGSWERNFNDGKLHWSDELYRILGFTPHEFEPTFEDLLSRIHPDDRESLKRGLADALKLKTHFEPEYRIVQPNGEIRYVRASGIYECNAEGKPQRSIGTVQDITLQKLHLKAVEESERKYRAILENASDGIIIANPDGRILDANRHIQTLLGYNLGELLALHVKEIHPPEVAEEHSAAFAKTVEQGFGLTERLVLCKDGTTIPVEITGTLIPFDSQHVVLGIFRDMRERKRTEAELHQYRNHLEQLVQQRTAELEAMNGELEAFSYSVSHDLRAPLRAINGFSEALSEDCGAQLDATGCDYLRRIKSATERMGRLIEDLLRLSSTIRAEMHWDNVSLSSVASDILLELRAADPGRKVRTLVTDEITACGDLTLIRSLLQNLLSNAWKFTRTRDNAEIEFGVITNEGSPVYFVRDNGIGFDMRYAKDLFEPFHRLHGSDYEGSGIGLATVQRIANRHGGRVWAESEPGQWATLFFTLGTA